MPDLVSNISTLVVNIERYWAEAQQHPDLIEDAAKARQWKCVMGTEGTWRCGPSRFVGYEGMTHSEYVARKKDKDGGLDGTETEQHLRRWTDPVPKGSRLHFELVDVVGDMLGKSGIRINKSASFSTIRLSEIEFTQTPADREQDIITALVVLSKSLSERGVRSLIRRLDAEK